MANHYPGFLLAPGFMFTSPPTPPSLFERIMMDIAPAKLSPHGFLIKMPSCDRLACVCLECVERKIYPVEGSDV